MSEAAELRTLPLCKAFGWQGGTIHQLAAETGISVSRLLFEDLDNRGDDYDLGWHVARTGYWNQNLDIYRGMRGNFEFWVGVADGIRTETDE